MAVDASSSTTASADTAAAAAIRLPYRKKVSEVLSELGTGSATTGLSAERVAELQQRFGANAFPEEPGTPLLHLILEQFEDKLVRILLASAFISFVLALMEERKNGEGLSVGSFVEPIVILLILIANAVVGVWQESNAEKAIEALKEYSAATATVVRDGHTSAVPASELVPGDIVLLKVGDRVPADCRMIHMNSTTVRVEQSALTGESEAVMKWMEPIGDVGVGPVELQSQTCMLFSGTTVVYGHAAAVVTATGLTCEIGRIRKDVAETESEPSPLKKKLDEFGDQLSNVIMAICVLVWLVNIGHFADPAHGGSYVRGAVYYFKIAVALAVAAIPEGLPAVVTTCLALGTRAMAKKNAIVRHLPSVETLGCTTVICSDKTGTLTTNMMSAAKVLTVDSNIDVDDTSFDTTRGHLMHPSLSSSNFEQLCKIASLCNEAKVVYNAERGVFSKIGEATEAALRVLVEKIGVSSSSGPIRATQEHPEACNDYLASLHERLAVLEFTRERRSMSVLCNVLGYSGKSSKTEQVLYVKGAPESILERSRSLLLADGTTTPLTSAMRQRLFEDMLALATGSMALRVLALAYKPVSAKLSTEDLSNPDRFAAVESDLIFVGMVGIRDPERPEVREAISRCATAGIRVVMITGDTKATAEAIGRRIGLLQENESVAGRSFTGREFQVMSRDEKLAAARSAVIFSRVEPAHKLELVRILQEDDEIVAMTGDGVNDSSALKKADIGIAMGSGTEVAKGAADMVLADDNMATIVAAVEEGRGIYNNTKQFIRYLISSNIGEVVCIFLTALLGMPEALVPVQLLWVNLVTDGLPATALGFNPPDVNIMRMRPRSPKEPIVNGWLFMRYVVIGIYVGAATIASFAWWFMYYEDGPRLTWQQLTNFNQCSRGHSGNAMCDALALPNASTVALSVLVTVEMFNAMNATSENESIFVMPPWVNPWLVLAITTSFVLHFMILAVPLLNTMFGVTWLTMGEWMGVIYFSLPVIAIDEVLKFVSRRRQSQTGIGRKKNK